MEKTFLSYFCEKQSYHEKKIELFLNINTVLINR